MFTEYTREEMEAPLNAETQGPDSEKIANTSSDNNAGFDVKDIIYETKEYYSNEQLPYDLEGESLW